MNFDPLPDLDNANVGTHEAAYMREYLGIPVFYCVKARYLTSGCLKIHIGKQSEQMFTKGCTTAGVLLRELFLC